MPETLREIYLVRHGQSLGQLDISNYKKIGDNNLPLTSLGQKQAYKAGLQLRTIFQSAAAEASAFNISAIKILHSTCRRATETAGHIARALGTLPVITTPESRLNKQAFGSFDGCFTAKERFNTDPEGYKAYEEHRAKEGLFNARPPQGESMQDVYNRIESVLKSLKQEDGHHIIVTHGLPILCAEAFYHGHTQNWIIEQQDTIENCDIIPIVPPGL